MSKARLMVAGNAGASRVISLNGNQGGGIKKQGTPSTVGRKSGINYSSSHGNNRNEVFFINQLGGVGKGRSMFAPSADGVRTIQADKSNPVNGTPLTLYYSLVDENNNVFVDTLNFQVTNPSVEYNGITMTALTNASFSPILDTNVVFVGHRVPNTNTSPFVQKIYDERFTVTDADGHEFSAAKVYKDESDGFETTVPFVSYIVKYASGKYIGKKTATIFFDNTGTGFGNGRPFARRIELN